MSALEAESATLLASAAELGSVEACNKLISDGVIPDADLSLKIFGLIEEGSSSKAPQQAPPVHRRRRRSAASSDSSDSEDSDQTERSLRKSWLLIWKSLVRAGGLRSLTPAARHALAERIIRGSYKSADGQPARYPSVTAHPPLLYPVVWDLLKPVLKYSTLDVNAVGSGGRTLLHWACESGCFELVWLLLRYDAHDSLAVVDEAGRTPAQVAAAVEQIFISDYLLKEEEELAKEQEDEGEGEGEED